MPAGAQLSSIPVPQGTSICVGIHACNTSPALWGADAEVWRPERWLEGLPEEVGAARVPGVYSNLCVAEYWGH